MTRRFRTDQAVRKAVCAVALVGLPLGGSVLGGIAGAGAVTGAITGSVFRDYNADGTRDANEPGIGGITVTVFDAASGALSQISNADGSYTISGLTSGSDYRVEFSGQAAPLVASAQSGTAGSSVQFVKENGIANFALQNPGEYCQANPLVAMTCFSTGIPSGATQGSIYTLPYNGGTPTQLATANATGPAYALAYQRSAKRLFSTNLVKRHVGNYENPIGTPKIGELFSTDPASGATIPFVDLESIGITVSDASLRNNAARGLGAATAPTIDIDPLNKVHKYGLLDMAITETDDALFVVNGKDSNLYKINLPANGSAPTSADVTNVMRPNIVCTNGVARPSGLAIKNAKAYLGFVCSAENAAGTAADLTAQVWTYDITSGGWNTAAVLAPFALNSYVKGCASVAEPKGCNWTPWRDTWDTTLVYGSVSGGANEYVAGPQPVLADLTFADDGSMILGFRDRLGDLTGRNQPAPIAGNTQLISGVPAGDIRKACATGSTFAIEGSTSCNVGRNEFYNNDSFSVPSLASVANPGGLFHDETAFGAVIAKPGAGSVMTTGMGAVNNALSSFFTSGVRVFSTIDGSQPAGGIQVLADSADRLGKGNGMGLLELLCDQAPVEIGNRVWADNNGDGTQTAGEPGIGGVAVRLLDSSSVEVASTITDTNGNYLFSSAATGTGGAGAKYGVAGLKPNTNYTVSIDTAQAPLTGKAVSPTDAPSLVGDSTQDDSDNDFALASATATAVTKSINSGRPGANHTYDAGFRTPVIIDTTCGSVGNFVWFDTNNNGLIDSGEVGAANLPVRLINATTGLVASSTTTNAQGYYLFSCVPAGSYKIQLTPPTGYTSSTPNGSDVGPNPNTNTADNDDNGQANAGGFIESVTFTVGGTNNPIGEPPTPGLTDTVPDNRSNLTVDFGLIVAPVVQPVSSVAIVTAAPTVVPSTVAPSTAAPSTVAVPSTAVPPTTVKPALVPTPSTKGTGAVCSEIFVDTNQNGVRDKGEPALPGVTVRLTGPNGLVRVAVTDSKGAYCFENLPDGEYEITIVSGVPGQYSYLTDQSVKLQVLGASAERPTAVFRVAPLALTGTETNRTIGMGMGLLLAGVVVRRASRPKGRHVRR
jgi:SdrD B-like domain